RADGLTAVLEIEAAAIDDERPGRGEAAAAAEPQRAGRDRRRAGVIVGAGEDQRAVAGLGQPAAAEDVAGERRRRDIGHFDNAAPGPQEDAPREGEVRGGRERA